MIKGEIHTDKPSAIDAKTAAAEKFDNFFRIETKKPFEV